MMSKFILIPVKDLTRAKQRLAGLLSQPERTELAWLMLEQTFAQAAPARGCDGVAVVTVYEPAIKLGKQYGFEIIPETAQVSESVSVDFGSRILAARGVQSVLRLPIDLPLITPDDIERILSRIVNQPSCQPSCVLVPSGDGTGTNALARTPPDLFPSHFGPQSRSKHEAEARQCAAHCELLELPRIALDLDDPGDVRAFLQAGSGSRVDAFLQKLHINERLAGFSESQRQ